MPPIVSVIIANRNDVSMLSVTVRSCIEELTPLGPGSWEIVIVDNSDPGPYQLLNTVLPARYIREKYLKIIRQDFPCLFTARETAAQQSSGKYLFCVDSHVLIGHNCIVDLVNFMKRKEDDETLGFAHAPINWAHQHEAISRHDRDVTTHELGDWNLAYQDERTITWKGMPWICRRDWFLDRNTGLNAYGALSAHRVSWGGGDMHIGVKPWLLGFKNWAVPTRPVIHIGPFPKIDRVGRNPNITAVSKGPDDYRYRLYAVSGEFPHTFGFLVSCYVLGGEPMMHRNKQAIHERFGAFLNVDKWWNKAIELGRGERKWLLERQVMSFEQFIEMRPWDAGQRDLQTVAV